MEKNLYIDASHPDETRIVLKSNSYIEEYEYENKNKLNFKNNIYLGTVSRVEPSLQAAFINFLFVLKILFSFFALSLTNSKI